MKCDRCGAIDYSRVIDSRSSTDFGYRRRRECLKCGFRFTTYEIKPSDLLRQYKAVEHTCVFNGIKSSD